MITDTNAYLLFAVFVAVQLASIRKRWSLATLRGPGWFLSVPVPADFYEGPGRGLLRTFRLWLLAPYALEAVAAAAILQFGVPVQLLYLAMVMVVVMVVNGVIASIACTKWAREYEVAGAASAGSSVVLSLTPRPFADYTKYVPMSPGLV